MITDFQMDQLRMKCESEMETRIDAARYRALKEIFEFRLGSYYCESGRFENATYSSWRLQTQFVFISTNKEPESIDTAIDEWMKRNSGGNESTSIDTAPMRSDQAGKQAE